MYKGLFIVFIPSLVLATDIPLRRQPSDYLVLGMRSARVFSFGMEPPGCNMGVNCAPVGSQRGACGFFHSKRARFPEPSQLAANLTCGTESFFQVFNNSPGGCAAPDCSMIAHPGSASDCTEPFTTPILGDLDGDATPSCDNNCATDLGDIATACGVELPLPPCDLSRPVVAANDSDCSIADVMPGNNRCDLAPGIYGALRVLKGARVFLGTGTTVVCSLKAGTATRLTSLGPATVLVPGQGFVKFNNSADVGSDCGVLRIVAERGELKFGRFGDYALDGCTLAGRLRLGHANNLVGHFIGDEVVSDIGNEGRCCPTTTTTTTTVAGATSTSTTSSTLFSLTSTTSTSTTSTTEPASSTTVVSTTSTTGTTGAASSTTSAPGTTTTSSSATSTSGAPTTSTTATTVAPTTSSTSTTATSSTTTTTVPGGCFTRTPGFYKNHPRITQQILDANGGLTVCGHHIIDVHVDHGHSALEGLCVAPQGDQRLQLFRQLLTAAFNMAASCADFPQFAACDTVCQVPSSTVAQLSDCINQADRFNQSGDRIQAPFDPPGPADPRPCQAAFRTACTVLQPAPCAQP